MLTVEFAGKSYEFDLDAQLKTLTGAESMLTEDYLGGWGNFRSPDNVTRSTIVILWLAKRSAGETTTFEKLAETPGLLFGDVWQVSDDGSDEIADPMEDPGRPLAERNGVNGASAGTVDSEATPEISDSSGPPALPVSTD